MGYNKWENLILPVAGLLKIPYLVTNFPFLINSPLLYNLLLEPSLFPLNPNSLSETNPFCNALLVLFLSFNDNSSSKNLFWLFLAPLIAAVVLYNKNEVPPAIHSSQSLRLGTPRFSIQYSFCQINIL